MARFTKVGATIALTAALGTASAAAYAGNLKYYDDRDLQNYLGEFACYTNKVMHDVNDDVINSVNNQTACHFSAHSWRLVPNTTIRVAYGERGEEFATVGDRNKQIDHFDRQ